MSDTALLTHPGPRRGPAVLLRRPAVVVSASGLALVGLGAMHFALDGLTSVLVSLQPTLAARSGARPALLGLVVATALATASLLQPLAARLTERLGERVVAAVGAILAAVGYGMFPAAGTVPQAVASVLVGGVGSALFHPAAGAMVVRGASQSAQAVALAAFSAVGTAGAALVPVAVLGVLPSLGWAAAVPVAVSLVALVVTTRARAFASPRHHQATTASQASRGGNRQLRMAVAAAALLALTTITTGATTPLLLSETFGPSHPALAWVAAAFSASGAVGGIVLAVVARRTGARRTMLPAMFAGGVAASVVPFLPTPLVFPAMVVAGAGLSGSLPLLMSHARRDGETSAAGAVGRVLGLGAGLGAVGYVAVGFLQSAVGYAVSLTVTAGVGAVAAIAVTWFLCRSVDPATCHVAVGEAAAVCPCGSCTC